MHLGKVLDLRRRPDGKVKDEEVKPEDSTITTEEGLIAETATTSIEAAPTEVADSMTSSGNAADVFSKVEGTDNDEEASIPGVNAEQGEKKRKMSASPPPLPDKRAKVEPEEVEYWDDGGVADDDLAGL